MNRIEESIKRPSCLATNSFLYAILVISKEDNYECLSDAAW